jgi:hypothetical protein
VEETGGSWENHWPAASHWQTLSHNVEPTTSVVIGTDCIMSVVLRPLIKLDPSK